jgi:hypothetical protein
MNKIYTAFFYTEADFAEVTIMARSPKLALKRARRIESDETEILNFQSYDSGAGIEHIEIRAPDGHTVAEWKHGDLHLRLAARDLLEALESQTEAAQAVIDSWAEGDLAAAVNGLENAMDAARAAIAKAEPPTA